MFFFPANTGIAYSAKIRWKQHVQRTNTLASYLQLIRSAGVQVASLVLTKHEKQPVYEHLSE